MSLRPPKSLLIYGLITTLLGGVGLGITVNGYLNYSLATAQFLIQVIMSSVCLLIGPLQMKVSQANSELALKCYVTLSKITPYAWILSGVISIFINFYYLIFGDSSIFLTVDLFWIFIVIGGTMLYVRLSILTTKYDLKYLYIRVITKEEKQKMKDEKREKKQKIKEEKLKIKEEKLKEKLIEEQSTTIANESSKFNAEPPYCPPPNNQAYGNPANGQPYGVEPPYYPPPYNQNYGNPANGLPYGVNPPYPPPPSNQNHGNPANALPYGVEPPYYPPKSYDDFYVPKVERIN